MEPLSDRERIWQGKLSRRSLLRGVVAGALLTTSSSLLAACGGDDDDDDDSDTDTTTDTGETGGESEATDTPAEEESDEEEEGQEETETSPDDESDAGEDTKDTLVIGFPTDITSLDIHKATGLHIIGFDAQICDVLIRLDENNEPIPWLAEAWEWEDDATSLLLTIRDDVPMHDGNMLTAEDVRYSIVRFREYSVGASALAVVTDVEAVDERTVKLSMDAPFAPLLPSLAYTTIGIYSKAAIEEAGDDDFHLNPIGPGPYKYLEKQEGEYVRLEAFDEYWAGAPQTQFVEVRALPEMGTRVQALEAGDVDLIFNVSPQDAERLAGSDNLKVLDLDSARLIRLSFNTQNAPVDNKLVRQAVAYGIDRQAIADSLFLGTATVSHSPGPEGAFGYTDEYDVYSYDPDKAKELLEEAGHSDGVSFQVHLSPGRYLLSENVVEAMRAQLLEAGIDMEIVPMEWGALSEFIRRPPGENEMQSAILGWRSINGDVDSAISDLHSELWPPEGNNTTYYENPEYDELLTQEQSEQDTATREQILMDMQRILMDDLPLIPLYHNPQIWAAVQGVEGVEVSALTCLQPLHTAVVKVG